MILGALRIELVATDDGDLQVQTFVEGTLQYVTAIGMLEMAKDGLDDLLSEEEATS